MTCRNHSTLTSHWSVPIPETSVAKSVAYAFCFISTVPIFLCCLQEQSSHSWAQRNSCTPELGSYVTAGRELNYRYLNILSCVWNNTYNFPAFLSSKWKYFLWRPFIGVTVSVNIIAIEVVNILSLITTLILLLAVPIGHVCNVSTSAGCP